MSQRQVSTNSEKKQLPQQSTIEVARSLHFRDLSRVAAQNLHSKGFPPDFNLAACLTSHLRAEFPNIPWPDDWADPRWLSPPPPPELIDTLWLVSHRRTFLGVCNICQGWEPTTQPVPADIATRSLMEAFLASKEGKVAEATLATYRNWLTTFANTYPVLPLTPEEIDRYLASKQSRKSAHEIYGGLKLFYEFLKERKNLPNPIASVERPRFKETEPDALSLDEAGRMFAAAETDREKAVVYLGLGQGFRKAEVLRLDVGDVGEDWVRVSGKERIEKMPLLPEVKEVLLTFADGKRPQQPLFTSQHKRRLSTDMCDVIVKKLFIRAGIINKRQSFHVLRHSFATLATEAGCDTHSVKRLMRHSVRNDITDHYIHASFDSLKWKLEKYSPLRLVNRKTEAKFGLVAD